MLKIPKGILIPQISIYRLMDQACKNLNNSKPVYNLTIGNPTQAVDDSLIDGMISSLETYRKKSINYTNFVGDDQLRTSFIAKFNQIHGRNLSKDNVLFTCGANEAMNLSFSLLASPIIIPQPAFSVYYQMCNASKKQTLVFDTAENNFGIDAGKVDRVMESLYEKRTETDLAKTDFVATFLLTDPGNPTGYKQSNEEIAELANLFSQKWRSANIIADSLYLGLTHNNDKANFYDYAANSKNSELLERTIYVDSISKVDSAAGLRAGYLVCDDKNFIQLAAQQRLINSVHPSIISQHAIVSAINNRENYAEKNAQAYSQNSAQMIETLFSERVVNSKPNAGFYVMIDLDFMKDCELSEFTKNFTKQYYGNEKAEAMFQQNNNKVNGNPFFASFELLKLTGVATVPNLPVEETGYIKIFEEDKNKACPCQARISSILPREKLNKVAEIIVGLKRQLQPQTILKATEVQKASSSTKQAEI